MIFMLEKCPHVTLFVLHNNIQMGKKFYIMLEHLDLASFFAFGSSHWRYRKSGSEFFLSESCIDPVKFLMTDC